ncbi:uncharacterized protein LOC119960732 [Scyliorhinus canicula]|uniref:uncharacterized protein LOC119960732 n=1 Tax=Scyliorhinus canicula TaxID=7830 RepID=UPI0018F2B56B|nr:uncharacterized protein LOC119960732 [Scyliorhinus canicula]
MFKTLIFLPFVYFGWLLGMDIFDLPLPDLTSFPSYGHFFTGENITLNCRCQCPAVRIQYYHNRNPTNRRDYDKRQCRTYLEYNDTVAIGGIYSCECLDWSEKGWRRSNLSHPIPINIGDRLSQPTINKFKNVGLTSSGEIVLISCNGDIRSSGGMFHLYRNRSMEPIQSHQMNGDQRTATFKVNVTGNDYLGSYGCRYQTHVGGNWTDSPWSKDVVVTENDQELDMSMPGKFLYLKVFLLFRL